MVVEKPKSLSLVGNLVTSVLMSCLGNKLRTFVYLQQFRVTLYRN